MNLSLSEILTTFLVVVALLALNALFVATEFSLVKLRFTRFGTDALDRARKNPMVARMLDEMGTTLKVVRLGVTVCTIGLGFVLLPLTLHLLGSLDAPLGRWEVRGAFVISFVVAVALHFVLGELVPRTIALQYPVQALRLTTWPVRITAFFVAPFLMVLGLASNLVLRILGQTSRLDLNLIDVEAQIRSEISDGEAMPALAEKMLQNVLELRRRVAQDILLPRNQIQFIDLEDDPAENIALTRRTGHTRFPLCEGDLDHCIGLVHIKDIFRASRPDKLVDLRSVRREILRFPADEPLEIVLQRFLRQKSHFALVTDEFGGTVGAITLEDILEELVGEIQDEFDREESLIQVLGDDRFQVDGLAPVHDVSDILDIPIDAEDVSTFGGLITSELGRIPLANETVVLGRLQILVREVDERRVLSTEVTVLPSPEAMEDGLGVS
ncbi:MAG: hemolysin family protein [Opitutaceae bacterium]